MAKDNTGLKLLGIAAGTMLLFAFKKKADYEEVIRQMTMDVRNVRNIRTKKAKLYLDIDLGLHNPTNFDFDPFTAGVIKLKQIKLFYKDVEIGNAYSDVAEISLPAKSNFLIQNIQVELLFLDIVYQFLTGGLDLNMSNYRAHIYIEALNKTWVLEQ